MIWNALQTDGTLLYGPGGEVLQRFSVYDGYAIECLRWQGVDVAILTGRTSPAVAQRARTLSIGRVVQGARDKGVAVGALARDAAVDLSHVCFVGDDVFDLPAMRLVGWSAAPANARPEVKAEATYVCELEGGRGAVREVAELILRARDAWPPAGAMPSALNA